MRGLTLGQDEASSLIYGMPRAAFESGAVMRQFCRTWPMQSSMPAKLENRKRNRQRQQPTHASA